MVQHGPGEGVGAITVEQGLVNGIVSNRGLGPSLFILRRTLAVTAKVSQ